MSDINKILDDVKNSDDEYLKIADEINKEKKELETKIVEDAIDIAASGILAIVGVIGVIEALVLLIPSGGGLVGIGLASRDIVRTREEIQKKVNDLNDLEQDKLQLQTWNGSVESAKSRLGNLKGDIEKIKDSWVSVKDGFM